MVDRGRGCGCYWRVCPVVGLISRLLCLVILMATAGCYSTSLPRHSISATAHSHKPVIRYVRANDTLYSIGKKFGINYRLIARRNHISYPYRIYIGQRLYIDRQAPLSHDPTAGKIRSISKAPPKKHRTVHKKRIASKSAHKTKAKGYTGRLLWPVKGTVTSKFGRRGSRMHDGIDINAREGTPVHAAASGEVVYADSRLSGYGKLIIIRHGKNLFTAYGHNQRMLVRKGTKVRAGDVIGRVGHTGRASGPHLHFEVRQGSTPVNPLAYLPH